jgi:hypothetical protein
VNNRQFQPAVTDKTMINPFRGCPKSVFPLVTENVKIRATRRKLLRRLIGESRLPPTKVGGYSRGTPTELGKCSFESFIVYFILFENKKNNP